MEMNTIPGMFWHAVETRGGKTALRQKELGIWKATSWREFGEAAREVGLGLVRLGFEPGETVSILSNTNREWMYADMGALGAGGVSSGIYPTDSASQVEYLLADSRSVYVFVEDEEQLDKVLEVRERLPRAAQDRGVRHGRAAALQRPDGDESRGPAPPRLRASPEATPRNGRPGCAHVVHKTSPSSSTPRAPPASRRAR